EKLKQKESSFLHIFPNEVDEEQLLVLLQKLARYQKKYLIAKHPEFAPYFRDIYLLHQFVELFYNFWRNYERFFVCYSDEMLVVPHYTRPYSTFNDTVEVLNHLVRKIYRDVCENITGEHPNVYRQVPAGAQVGLIVVEEKPKLPYPYTKLERVNFIKQVLIEPPLIIDPPTNTRTGEFKRVEKNPLDFIPYLEEREWLCYPAQVGDLVIHVFFSNKFIGLGTALSNLFDLATEDQLKRKPDAVFLYGVPKSIAKKIDVESTVFFEDELNVLLVGCIPEGDEFAYFGYLKKMMLTLHNVIMMKRNRLPVHGAMVKIGLKNKKSANIIFMGDTGAGKSESLEAFRRIGEEYIREMTVVFDDMGSLGIENGKIKAYGTETGAFVRLDDLNPGFAFGNIDRSIIMSPQKKNARVVLPITTLKEVLEGQRVDYLLYANNYEVVDKTHSVIEVFKTSEEAIEIFRRGRSMAKGTTSLTGINETYFVNIFGPAQYKELHNKLAEKFFITLFENKTVVGQIRTRLGISGFENSGPKDAARALLE
ncbi:MAG: phosphoenolpyruvate carboxykinase, partial [Candidatus Diapherotrites archaeon]|nr:phosphoenolpyruvate carboxykinase [Candidatus Diapherotrites archaeon]